MDDSNNSSNIDFDGQSSRRNEVHEIEKSAAKEYNRVKTWRWALMTILLLTAGVTGATYAFLVREEKNSFSIAVRSM